MTTAARCLEDFDRCHASGITAAPATEARS
jgi:hypothetical protein